MLRQIERYRSTLIGDGERGGKKTAETYLEELTITYDIQWS